MTELVALSVLGLIEGLTEFLPISSTGHLIIARDYFAIATTNGLAIDAVLQLSTILALIVYFFSDLLRLARAGVAWAVGSVTEQADLRFLFAIVCGTVPAVIFGLLLEDIMGTVFRSPHIVAVALIVGSVIMLSAEWWKVRVSKVRENISWKDGLVIGLFQSLALVPGMSRSGMTTAGGMFLGFTRAESTAIGFILSVPVLVGAGLKKLYELSTTDALITVGPELALGSLIAFVVGIATIHVFLIIVRKTPLTVFVVYRVLLAGALLLL